MPRSPTASRTPRPTPRWLAALPLIPGLMMGLVAGEAQASDRWPLWPSEVTRAAAALHAGKTGIVLEAHKLQALRSLERYPTALVGAQILAALEDGTASIRREALQACLERLMQECIPAALTEWRAETGEPAVRIAALRVLALAGASQTTVLLAALRDLDESVRAEAAHTLARVAWPEDVLPRVRTALIGKLADTAPPVRRAAARSLGLLGPPAVSGKARATDPAPLALARLLPDPDPQVRQDAADALGNLRDPRAAPPLLRALETGDEVYVSRQMILALAALPGPEVDAALLRLLDAPPRGLTYRNVGEALGRRPAPSPALIDGLVARLREEALQPFVLDILLMLGDAAAPALRAAQTRGLEPPLALAVTRLLSALTPPTEPPPTPPWPAADDPTAWARRLTATDVTGALAAAAALADLSPRWLAPAAAAALARLSGPAPRRPWLLALAASRHAQPVDPLTPARLAGWSGDLTLAPLDRCLALAALARTDRAHAHLRVTALTAAASDLSPAIRACAAAAARDPVTLAGLLHDPSPRVRALASFTLAACHVDLPADIHAELARLALTDPHPGVAQAAAAATLRPSLAGPCRWQLVDAGEPTVRNTSTDPGLGWVDLTWRDQPLRLPVEPLGDHRWLLLPSSDLAVLTPPDLAAAPRQNP